MAGLRLVMGAEVHAGNEHTSLHTQPGLLKILDDLPPSKKPQLVLGDNGFGNEGVMKALEEREQRYLFKPKRTKNVKRYIGKLFGHSDWSDAGQGWQGKDGEFALTGWQANRRVVVLRRPFKGEVVVEGDDNGQQLLDFVQSDRKDGKGITGYEYAGAGDQHRLQDSRDGSTLS